MGICDHLFADMCAGSHAQFTIQADEVSAHVVRKSRHSWLLSPILLKSQLQRTRVDISVSFSCPEPVEGYQSLTPSCALPSTILAP